MRMILLFIVAALVYFGTVMLLGFEGPVAVSINFSRVTIATTVLILFVPALPYIFKSIPPPARDYLLAGIILTWASNFLFSISNETGKIFDAWDSSVFTNPIPGFFSFLLVMGGIFHMLAPDSEENRFRRRGVALAVGAIVAALVTLVAPQFRF